MNDLIELKLITREDAECLHKLQIEAFMPLYEKYQDDATSPAKESLECFLQPLITKKCRMLSQKLQREIPHFCMCLQRSFYAGEMSLQTYFCF